MLVEINLLPQKEQRTKGFLVTVSGLIAVLLLISGFYLWQINSTKKVIEATDSQISSIKKVAEKETAILNTTPESTQSVNLLLNAVDWANNYPIQTVPVMQHLTSLLPERGFIQSFGYTETGLVTLMVQFDSSRESAYFLDSLNESKWIEEANLSSLTTTEQNDPSTQNQSNEVKADQNVENNIYLPRYIGQYEIQFNKVAIQKLINEGFSSEEGAENS